MFFEKSLTPLWPVLTILDCFLVRPTLSGVVYDSTFGQIGRSSTLTPLFLSNVHLFIMTPTNLSSGLYFFKLETYKQFLQNTWLIHTVTYLDLYYKQFFCHNHTYCSTQLRSVGTLKLTSGLYTLKGFLKLIFLLFVSLLIFHFNFLNKYIAHLKSNNYFLKLFLLHESEKEVGQADDIFQFIILFLITLFSFILASMGFFFFFNGVFVWPFVAILSVSFLVLTVPLNLLLDFGISFTVYVKGTGAGSVLLKEVLFDVISTFIIFIRFLIQNVRFLFIFLAIFELFEWVYAKNNVFFSIYFVKSEFSFYALDFVNLDMFTLSTFFLNSLTFIVLYLYYFLHLLFLLIVQISIYIGILLWLFFFLYSTRFFARHESFFKLTS